MENKELLLIYAEVLEKLTDVIDLINKSNPNQEVTDFSNQLREIIATLKDPSQTDVQKSMNIMADLYSFVKEYFK